MASLLRRMTAHAFAAMRDAARELDIAPGTVMVHKRNLFAKLDISSQYELFSLLIDDLRRS